MVYREYYTDIPREEVDRFVESAPMGRLVTVAADGMPHVGLFNFVYTGERVELHLARDDEQVADLRRHPQAVFEIDEYLATIPSYFVHAENAATATSYHRTVVIECEGTVSEDVEAVVAQQQLLLAKHQPEGGYRPLKADAPLYRGLLLTLTAVSLRVLRLRPKFKLGQNRPPTTRRSVAEQLRARGRPLDSRAAEALLSTIGE